MSAQTIRLTLFRDKFASTKDEQDVSLDALACEIQKQTAPSKSELPWVKLAVFGNLPTSQNSLRWDGNVNGITGVEGDYDSEIVSFDEAVEIAEKEGLLSIIYTSPSYTPDKPRWRIRCPTSATLAPEQRAPLLDRLNGLYRGIFAAESWTLSQSYYFGSVNRNPNHRVEIIEGQPLDLLDNLDLIAIGKPATKAAGNGANPAPSGYTDEQALIEQIVSGESDHTAAIRLLGLWARQGVAMVEAERRALRAFDCVFPADRDDDGRTGSTRFRNSWNTCGVKKPKPRARRRQGLSLTNCCRSANGILAMIMNQSRRAGGSMAIYSADNSCPRSWEKALSAKPLSK